MSISSPQLMMCGSHPFVPSFKQKREDVVKNPVKMARIKTQLEQQIKVGERGLPHLPPWLRGITSPPTLQEEKRRKKEKKKAKKAEKKEAKRAKKEDKDKDKDTNAHAHHDHKHPSQPQRCVRQSFRPTCPICHAPYSMYTLLGSHGLLG
jgi:hypothetical protein